MRAERRHDSNAKGTRQMKHRKQYAPLDARHSMPFVLMLLVILLIGVLDGGPFLHAQTQEPEKSQAQAVKQDTFSTPDEAMRAFIAAAEAKDRGAITKIFGPGADQLLSGDPIEDNKDLEEFATAARDSAGLEKDGDTKYTLVVGKNNWPTPIPIVKKENRWFFDTQAGIDEILNRRIGENELSAITTCRAYVVAQWEYFTEGEWGRDGVAAYAQKFISSPGEHDGLYWKTLEGEKASPLGELVAAARAEGYGPGQRAREEGSRERRPYHGYYFKILTRQGPNAPGGQYDYIINGNMIAGFALLAYPDKWGNSGVMTFIVNQQGRVYEKNLGPDTAKIAGEMTVYNPDKTWKLVAP
jgi:Protein of unknown function (DUF2950)